MYVFSVVAALLLVLGANAITVSGVRDLPGRYVHSKTVSHEKKPDSSAADFSSVEAASLSPDTVVVSRPDYIKGFLVFDSFNVVSASVSENGPLNSKFTNLDRHLSDETNLKSWTRFLVEHSDDTVELPPAPSVDEVDLDIGRFIDYLVTARNFKAETLEFLQQVPMELSYDEIENELADIKERDTESKVEEEPMVVVENSTASFSQNILTFIPILCLFLTFLLEF